MNTPTIRTPTPEDQAAAIGIVMHGFEAVGEIQVGWSPTIVPIVRRPRRRG